MNVVLEGTPNTGGDASGAVRHVFARAARRRQRILSGDTTVDARVVDVVVFVLILTDERLAREEEDVGAVRARIAEVGGLGALPRGDQIETATSPFAEARAGTFAGARAFALPLVHIGLFVRVLRHERFFGLEEDAAAVVGEVARQECIAFRVRLLESSCPARYAGLVAGSPLGLHDTHVSLPLPRHTDTARLGRRCHSRSVVLAKQTAPSHRRA